MDALTGRLPLWLAAVPIAAFGAYGVVFAREQLVTVPAVAAEVGRLNATAQIAFDPASDRLTVGHPREYVVNFALAAYSASDSSNFSRLALNDPANCLPRPSKGFRIEWRDRIGYCLHSTTVPQGPTHSFEEPQEWDKSVVAGMETDFVSWTVKRGGTVVSQYRTAKIDTLLPVPLLILGCGPDGRMDDPIKCEWKFWTQKTELGLLPDLSAEMSAIAKMLGLSRAATSEMDRWAIKR